MPLSSRPFNADRFLRLAHGYMGMLIAPSLLFFAVSGGLQVFRLNEAHGAYKPPQAFVVMGAFHKNQAMPRPRPPEGGGGPPGDRGGDRGERSDLDRGGRNGGDRADARGGDHGDRVGSDRGGRGAPEGRGGPEGRGPRDRGPRPPPKPSTLALKWLSVGVSVGLFLSTALGVWMGLRDRLRRWVNLALLAAGTLIPLALALV